MPEHEFPAWMYGPDGKEFIIEDAAKGAAFWRLGWRFDRESLTLSEAVIPAESAPKKRGRPRHDNRS